MLRRATTRTMLTAHRGAAAAAVGASRRAYGTWLGAEQEELGFAPTKRTKFEPSEPVFMTQFAFSASATRDSLKDAQDEERATARLLGVMGGTLKSYFVSQTGEYDGVVIYSFPKNHDSRTFTTLLKASGKIDKLTTTKLMTSSDAAQCGKAAKEVHEMMNVDN